MAVVTDATARARLELVEQSHSRDVDLGRAD
jgi:hypothetical protein